MIREVELALGTAQFGMAYGVSGRAGPVPMREVREILECAWNCGIRMLDTAPAYGDIEERLSGYLGERAFHVISKIPALPAQSTAAEAAGIVERSIHASRSRLGSNFGTVLFHRGADLLERHGDEIWRAASDEAARAGVRLGVSCYEPAEAIAMRERFPVAVAQLPGNALDQRLLLNGAGDRLAEVEVHLRSVFLQGLLLLPQATAAARVPSAAQPLAAWTAWLSERGIDALHGALGIAKALPGVRYCVVGVDCRSQLEEIAAAWQNSAPLAAAVSTDDLDVIDPRRWAIGK